jgi:hypothetical protein
MVDSVLASKWCKSRCGKPRFGALRSFLVWCGCLWLPLVDLSAEGFGPLRWVLWNPDLAGQGRLRCGQDRSNRFRRGRFSKGGAWLGNRCRRQHWGLRLPLLLSLRVDMARPGTAWRGKAWLGMARRGVAWRGLQTAVRRVYPPYCSLGNRFGLVEQGVA